MYHLDVSNGVIRIYLKKINKKKIYKKYILVPKNKFGMYTIGLTELPNNASRYVITI